MNAAASLPVSSASSPNVAPDLPQRGSVATSAIGPRRLRMPIARSSRRTVSPNRSASPSSAAAARPNCEGHWLKPACLIPLAGLKPAACRGSELRVIGIPRRVRSAILCKELCQRATDPGPGATRMLKCDRCRPTINSVVGATFIGCMPSTTAPLRPIAIGGWNINPAFSSTDIRLKRSFTRSATGARGSS